MIKKYYDKGLFLIALLVFSSVLVKHSESSPFSKKPFEDEQVTVSKNKKRQVRPYSRPTVTTGLTLWQKPPSLKKKFLEDNHRPLSEPLIVEMFTPPEIHFNKKTHAWSILPSLPLTSSFGLKIKAVTRQLYRFQYQGFIKNTRSDAEEDYLILLKDIQTGQKLYKRKGELFNQGKTTLESIVIEKGAGARNQLKNNIQVILEDKQLGKAVTLNNQNPTYTETLNIKLYDPKNPETRFEWANVGDTIQMGKQTYTLNKIDLTKEALLIEKGASGSEEKMIRTFSIKDFINPYKKSNDP